MPTINALGNNVLRGISAVPANMQPRIKSLVEAAKANELKLKNLEKENKTLKADLNNKTKLSRNPVVKQLLEEKIAAERRKQQQLSATIRQKDARLASLTRQLKTLRDKLKLADAKPKPLPLEEYNDFIARSIVDLKKELIARPVAEQAEDDYELVVSDIEVETVVVPERRGSQTGFLLPSREELTSLPPEGLQRIRYKISAIPK